MSMKREVVFRDVDPLFLTKVEAESVQFDSEIYLFRLKMLVERMIQKGLTHVIIYGDREHFSNIEYFTSYDCRFEESLLVVDSNGGCSIIVGNEGMGYSAQIPFNINRVLYQNFSLQGQPRDKMGSLSEIFKEMGITGQSKIGLVGYKYYDAGVACDSAYLYDIPAYILHELYIACPAANVIDFNREITGCPDGIRMRLYNAKEIAWAEYAGNRSANVMLDLLFNLRPGISEFELSKKASAGFDLVNMYPIVNFGERSVALGLKSPLEGEKLKIGEVCGLCYSVRGCNTARVGVAAYDENSYSDKLKPYLKSFYMKFWEAMAAWYEAAGVSCPAGALYDAVMSRTGTEEFGITLNPGHFGSTDEWSNSPIHKDSKIKIPDGTLMQVDIIASKSNPVRTSICEDAVVFASTGMRDELREQYPKVYDRIILRQKKMREVLGINISDDILPMSNLNGVLFPFMLNLDIVLAFDSTVK